MRFFITSLVVFCIVSFGYSQQIRISKNQNTVYPTTIKTPIGFSISAPLRDAPIVLESEDAKEEFYMNKHRDRELNPNIFPPDFKNMPPDPGEQNFMGTVQNGRGLEQNFAGINSGSYPPDCNGTVGPSHYFQVVNVQYQIFNKSDGSSAAGPSSLNSIFDSGLPGAGCNSGDPIVLWDEQADRWLYSEFSLCGSNHYMLIAVSTSNDPTGTWYSWSFDVDDTPDYMKFGIWEDGYYMATNTSGGDDVYVFERDVMLAGGTSPTMVGFDNSERPITFDGFHCLLPLDNDGPWAPSGTPGQFITIADNDQGNDADMLVLYELDVNWALPGNSSFSKVDTLHVNSFAGNFSGDWNNIPQPGSGQKLDAISTVLMYRAQYRNDGGTEKIVCLHAIAESSTESALRWYELENTGSGWSIAQQGTYNPDGVSRWNASIAMNDAGQIAMGYSVSDGSSTYPGIRYCGQNTGAPSGVMDIAETTIWTGAYSQSGANRWGDYCNISIDPSDGLTFWYTNEYQGSSTHGTRIAEITFPAACVAPTTQSTNFSTGSVAENSVDISWTRGNGDAVIILAREASLVNSNPVSGNTYSANSVFGSGDEIGNGNFVVYNGTGTIATITGLTAGTEYYFSMYEYLNTDVCYLLTAHQGSATTLGPPSLTTTTVTGIIGTTASSGGNISSNNGATVTARGVCWNTSGTPIITDPKTTDGSGTGLFTSTLTGLSPVTMYYVRAYATNSYGTAYGNEVLFTSACGIVNSFPFIQNFDVWTSSSPDFACTADGTVSLSDCWMNVTGDDIDWDILSGATGSGSTGPTTDYSGTGNYLYTESSSCFNSTGYLRSPDFDLTGTTNPELQFFYHMYGANMGSLSVQVSTDGGTSWSADVWSLTGDQGDSWQQAAVSLAGYGAESNVSIRFKAVTGSDYTSDMAIDEVSVVSACTPPTTQASSFTATEIGDNQMTVNWIRGNGTNVLVVARQGSTMTQEPISGIAYSADASFGSGDEIGTGNFVIYNGNGTSVSVTSLMPGSDYYFAIYEYFTGETCYAIPGLTGNETTTGEPQCTTYCAASGGGDEYISGVQLGLINNTGTTEGGYEDFTALSTDVTVNQSYNITITNGNSYSTDDLGIWVDWNQDCDFDDADENAVCAIDDGAEGTYSFTVPDTALIGTTTMRIRIKYSGDDCGSPCGTPTWGEVEDYTVNVQPGSSMWNGTTTNWNDPTNWPDGIIPHASYEVVIPTTPVNGEFPEIPVGTNAECFSLTIQPGATIIINGNLEEKK